MPFDSPLSWLGAGSLAIWIYLVFFNGRIIRDAAASETDAHDLGRAIAGKLSS